MRKLSWSVSLLVSVSSILWLAACGKSAEDRAAGAALSAVTGANVDVAANGEKVTLGEGDEAMTISNGDSAQLPSGFAGKVFLPGDYTIDSVVDSAGFTMVALRVPGEVAALADKARQHMLDGGWKQGMAAGDDNSRIMTFQNERNMAALSFDRHDDGGVLYSVQLSPVSH